MMRYTISPRPTFYNGTKFRSRLEATWAAFFDLMEWKWQYEPIDLRGWTPDFLLKIPCDHPDCPDTHDLFVEVKPFRSPREFCDHILTRFNKPFEISAIGVGIDLWVSTEWEMTHGEGGGVYTLPDWYRVKRWCWENVTDNDFNELWREAENLTRWTKQ